MKTVAITGHEGFVARHVARALTRAGDVRIRTLPRERDLLQPDALPQFLDGADVVLHLAGVNRAAADAEFVTGNVETTRTLLAAMAATGARPLLVYASSMQAYKDTVYGKSKRQAEDLIREAGQSLALPYEILRITNVFGAGCKPFYNSVVATFCHQVARGEEPTVLQDAPVALVSVTRVATEMARLVAGWDGAPRSVLRDLTTQDTITVSALRDLLSRFARCRREGLVPEFASQLERELYATLLTYYPAQDWIAGLVKHTDARGDLVESFRLERQGQVFFSTSGPGVVRGNHCHARKVERFLVVSGDAEINLRHLDATDVTTFRVSGDAPKVVEIPVDHAHNIRNVGSGTLTLLVWVNERFDPADPDTFPATV
jgi:UDP-2-acetamido-2,6-beta-L-arabino-hexul-4-ose reductase